MFSIFVCDSLIIQSRSSIPKPGTAAGTAPTSVTPSTPSSGSHYLVRTFSTRARNMNYTPARPYSEVSDSAGSTNSDPPSVCQGGGVTTDPHGLTAQKCTPRSRPVSACPGGDTSRPNSATVFYHKQSKHDGVMPRTDVARRHTDSGTLRSKHHQF